MSESNTKNVEPKMVKPKNVFWHTDGGLVPFQAPEPQIATPGQEGIQPGKFDDTSAPNAIKVEKLNRIASWVVANVGFSKSSQQAMMPPSAIDYVLDIAEKPGSGTYGLRMQLTLEYANPNPGEGMVVWLKRAKQFVSENSGELLLVDTTFYDLVNGNWIRIDTDIRFAEEAEAVSQAVMQSDSGQTVGKQSSAGSVDDAKLGPVGERARVVLTYRCEKLYSYAEMAMGTMPVSRNLVPLALHLPHTPLDNPGGAIPVSVKFRCPAGARSLDLKENPLVIDQLAPNNTNIYDSRSGSTLNQKVMILPTCKDGVYNYKTPVLPPCPTCLLFWPSCGAEQEGEWEIVDDAPADGAKARKIGAVLQRPSKQDANFLKAHLPGTPECSLYRLQLNPPEPKLPDDMFKVHTDVTISDASGSTGMTIRSGDFKGKKVRSEFNRLETRRFAKRIASLPLLMKSGVFRKQDCYRSVFCIFHHNVKEFWTFGCKVGDITEELAAEVQKLADGKEGKSDSPIFKSVKETLDRLNTVTPGGATSFVSPAKRVVKEYSSIDTQNLPSDKSKIIYTTYVNWDTDGGNNCGPCYEAIRQLRDQADVEGGFVMGVGAWVDQECATRVSRILNGPCMLSSEFPSDDAAQDLVFRKDLHHWIQAIKSMTIRATISAGAVSWNAFHGSRYENAVDVLAMLPATAGSEDAKGPPQFDLPDITEMDHTKAVIKGIREPLTLYILSRLPVDKLSSRLRISLDTGDEEKVYVAEESQEGVFLAHDWMKVVDGKPGVVQNRQTLSAGLRHLLEYSLSFNFNLPTTSGSTARLGRAKTAHRPPVLADKQPKEPELEAPPNYSPPFPDWNLYRSASPSGGPPAGAPIPIPGGAPYPVAGGFAPSMLLSARSGFALKGSAPAPRQMAPRSTPESLGSRSFGSRSGGYGFQQNKMSSKPKSRSRGKRSRRKVIHSPEPISSLPEGPATAAHILRNSGSLALRDAANRDDYLQLAWKRASMLVKTAQMKGAAPKKAEKEDPLVAALLGAPAPKPKSGYVHQGFECDVCSAHPIAGVRYKSVTWKDWDLCEKCYKNMSDKAMKTSYKALPTATALLRHFLLVIQVWWPVVADWKCDGSGASKTIPEALQGADVQALSEAKVVSYANEIFFGQKSHLAELFIQMAG